MSSQKSHITGMAGEFFVMEKLFRLGHEASIILGNAKNIDIFCKSPTEKLYEVSVKTIRGGGKWGVGKTDYSDKKYLFFVLLHYKTFDDIYSIPDIWVVPAIDVEKIKKAWFDSYAIYCSNKEQRQELKKYSNAWHFLA
jgi:hypothetical protein